MISYKPSSNLHDLKLIFTPFFSTFQQKFSEPFPEIVGCKNLGIIFISEYHEMKPNQIQKV